MFMVCVSTEHNGVQFRQVSESALPVQSNLSQNSTVFIFTLLHSDLHGHVVKCLRFSLTVTPRPGSGIRFW